MKPSELRKIYIASVRLYGFIRSTEIFELLDHYNINYNENAIYKDLRSRLNKFTKDYRVYEGSINHFLITSDYDNDESIEELAKSKAGKPFYYPKTYEEFLNYSNPSYNDKNDVDAIENISNFLSAKFDINPIEITIISSIIVQQIRYDLFTNAMDLLEDFDLEFQKEKDVDKFIKLVAKYHNNLRMPDNNGFTPNELAKLHGPIDINNLQITIGPNMRKNFFDDTIDPYELLEQVEKSNIPQMAKESLKTELMEIIRSVKTDGKA